MIKQATKTLAILAATTLVSCSNQLPSASSPSQFQALRMYTSPSAAPLVESFRDSYLAEQPHIQLETRTSSHSTLLEQLLQGEINHFISNHLPTLDAVHVVPLAQDALTLISHPENPVQNLSSEQIRRIYRGYIQNWSEVGGEDLDIAIFSREGTSGTRAEFERLVMGQQRTSPNAIVLPSNQAMVQQIARTPGAIGYIPLSQISQQQESLRAIAIDGQSPTLTHVITSRYPLRMTYYLISRTEPEAPYQDFANWVQGVEGQASLGRQFAPLP